MRLFFHRPIRERALLLSRVHTYIRQEFIYIIAYTSETEITKHHGVKCQRPLRVRALPLSNRCEKKYKESISIFAYISIYCTYAFVYSLHMYIIKRVHEWLVLHLCNVNFIKLIFFYLRCLEYM